MKNLMEVLEDRLRKFFRKQKDKDRDQERIDEKFILMVEFQGFQKYIKNIKYLRKYFRIKGYEIQIERVIKGLI